MLKRSRIGGLSCCVNLHSADRDLPKRLAATATALKMTCQTDDPGLSTNERLMRGLGGGKKSEQRRKRRLGLTGVHGYLLDGFAGL